jgi:penicillin amidase
VNLSPLARGKSIPRKRIWAILNLLISLCVTGLLFYVAASGLGSLPPPGPALNPNAGIWNAAQTADLQSTETLHFHDLQKPVTITFEKNGTPHIQAATDADLFWTIGYLHARFRLTQMDLERRQGEGKLSEIVGPEALDSDKLEVSLGLRRSAEADWKALEAKKGSGYKALTSYAQGVNALIQQEVQNNTLPVMFTLLNYKPRKWTPVDSLVVEEEETQDLDFTSTPLDYCLFAHSLGYDRTMQWFPIIPPDTQHPYDTGPYNAGLSQPASVAPLPTQTTCLPQNNIAAISDLASQIAQLPAGALHQIGSSNNWAVNGPKTASGNALMAGDPHLHLTLPAIWYQLEASSPGYSFRGMSIPGLPVVVIGQNQNISWSLTDVQNQSTLYYVEKTDAAHPDQYYWNGTWKHMEHVHYTIPIKGAATLDLDAPQTVHGPIISESGLPHETISVAWMGNQPTAQIEGTLSMLQASNFTQFREALRTWVAPTLNFVYADAQGNIGMISPGAYPLVKAGAPWLPLPGTGEADISGFIPFDDIPQVYNPPDHFVFSANQRPVSSDYPYYIGTSLNDFENGYRANEIYTQLSQGQHLTMQDMERLQNSTQDYLARLIVPNLLTLLKSQKSLTPPQRQGMDMLATWDNNMLADATAPSIWWTFWQQYVRDTFEPWWQAKHVPEKSFKSLAIGPDLKSLTEDLETWTLNDPTNAAFTLPSGQVRTANDVMWQAYQETITSLTKTLGSNPQQWTWGKLHKRKIDSLIQVDELAYGPFPSDGDSWTINAADTAKGMIADHGPSCRIIVDWGNKQSELAYPGGQDENPLSPWYQNQITTWWHGQYNPALDAQQAQKDPDHITWNLSQ